MGGGADPRRTGVLTDADGRYRIGGLSPGEYGVQAYGIGPRFDEAEFAEHGWHSDVERLSEDSLHGFVQFMWYAVVGIAATK